MSKSDLTPEQQETTVPSVIMAANGTTHTAEEPAIYVCDLDMFVQVQLFQRITPRMAIQVSENTSSRMGETSSVPTTTFLWWSHACKQPNTRPKFWTTGNRQELWETTSDVWKQNYLTWPHCQQQFFRARIRQQNLLQTEREESTNYSHIFQKT